ncbi:MAG: MATE family efflux transporter [Pseudomonadales bacterium]|jgi:putative MATE family efflux protein|uniref:MATE family efflux transporter n=1 Tax=unclassified Ketobacter TaxID=2639109 RepID=UPI000C3D3A45|nr:MULTISPECIES: MATE family efflux transporter [unclassified Ketobacter]MAA60094.1 MATE family efflux transporter [Pseudomonadales bacterium]MEC8809761.1 MATE family efflux transporter [Pseudomonadota bacterium]TNC90655.1 MAG: MATE family efflux transporter [Alcanivorax sp.]HAG95755.1 MATE family efflux transporter [Gammaproteobacteria bacterium]MAQ25647.1 MATE family efflux transporter [Pseudomonadales bacterium]|tara:strand:+ start:617 stop:1975 length:1359 start_codon:yes stop_codon:yes gene_type:complete
MSGHRHKDLLNGPIVPTLTSMTIPTVFGIVAILMFNLVDTYFIGLIGTQELAAVSFTFPVSNVLMNISMGIGIGTAIHISSRIGRGDISEARRTAAHALTLALTIAIPIGIIGNLTIDPLFRLMGANDHSIDLIREYMSLWYGGFFLLVVPMVGNSVIRATGDTRTPSIVMAIAGLVNGIMDPLLIFGIGPFPELGIRGAAIATLIAWALSASAVLVVLVHRRKLMRFSDILGRKREHWASILRVALPATATNLMTPLAAAVLTAMVARHGHHAVAGFGVGTRIEALALVVIIALSSALTPFVGQNFGARNGQRIREAVRMVLAFAFFWELGIAVLLYLTGDWVARVFSDEPATHSAIVWYLILVPISYGFQSLVILSCSTLNALQLPLFGTLISVIRLFLLTVPLAWLGSSQFGFTGLFGGIALANLIAGVGTVVWLSRQLPRLSQNAAPA